MGVENDAMLSFLEDSRLEGYTEGMAEEALKGARKLLEVIDNIMKKLHCSWKAPVDALKFIGKIWCLIYTLSSILESNAS